MLQENSQLAFLTEKGQFLSLAR